MGSPVLEISKGQIRLLCEAEYEIAQFRWHYLHAQCLATPEGQEQFDKLAHAAEHAWRSVGADLRNGATLVAVMSGLSQERLLPVGEKLDAHAAGELVGAEISFRLAKFDEAVSQMPRSLDPCRLVVSAEELAAEICEVNAICAGLVRQLFCAHSSMLPPSQMTVMLLDPALNSGEIMDAAVQAAATALVPFVPATLESAMGTQVARPPTRVTDARPRIWHDGRGSEFSAAADGHGSRHAEMSIAEVVQEMLANQPHLSELPSKYVAGRMTWSNGYRKHFDGFASLLSKAFGVRPAASLQTADFQWFFGLLEQLPKTHHKSKFDNERSLQEIIERAAERVATGDLTPGQIGIGAGSVNRNVALCRHIFGYLARYVELPNINWTQFNKPVPPAQRNRAYSAEEVSSIFALPIYKGRSSASGPITCGLFVWHNAAYWVCLLIVYSGARLGEICGLQVTDVKQLHGIWYFELRHNTYRRLKTPAAVRDIPLHSELIRLGFLQFIDELKSAGQTKLFPELYSASDRPIACGYIELIGIHMKRLLPFMKDGDLMHPARHYVNHCLKLCDVTVEGRQALLGHRGTEKLKDRVRSLPHLKRMQRLLQLLPNVTAHLERHPILLHPVGLRQRRSRPRRNAADKA